MELSRPWKNADSNVKDLEDAMKKHLPVDNNKMAQPPTIQWIGKQRLRLLNRTNFDSMRNERVTGIGEPAFRV